MLDLLFLLCACLNIVLSKVITLGVIFETQEDLTRTAYIDGVHTVNSDRSILPGARLIPKIVNNPPGNSYKATVKACEMIQQGVSGILDCCSTEAVSSVCDSMRIPHIQTSPNYNKIASQYTVNIHPYPQTLSQAYRDIVMAMNWKSFVILYEDNDGIVKLQELLKAAEENNKLTFHIRKLPKNHDFRPLFKSLHKRSFNNIIVDCHRSLIPSILKQAKDVSMMTQYHSYLFTSLDLSTLDLEEFTHQETNITGLSFIDFKNDLLNSTLESFRNLLPISEHSHISARKLTLETALTFDAVFVFAEAVRDQDLLGHNITEKSIICDSDQFWKFGEGLISSMKIYGWKKGLTGEIRLDNQGLRSQFTASVIQIKNRQQIKNVGSWNPRTGYKSSQTASQIYKETLESLANKTLIVTTALSAPYTMNRTSETSPDENYEGYAVDLIDEISKILKFKFKFKLVNDGKYGSLVAGEWNGMIRELQDGKADLAIVDLTITHSRSRAVDFTTPFMNLGISILYKKPSKPPANLFTFLDPLSMDVWIYMTTAYLGVSVLLCILARFCSSEWTNPYSCVEEPEELENELTLSNAFWHNWGSLMQQGSDIAPKAVPTRLVASIWWFFTLIIISSYTANLAAFLTVQKMNSPIKSADDLAKQTKIKYGTKEGGSTLDFFKKSKIPKFKRMWTFMESETPPVFTQTNQEGVDRVKRENGDYAYLMESTSIQYQIEKNCDLQQVGQLLDSKGYGIALPLNSPYTTVISKAILQLQESNRLYLLKQKWWKEKNSQHKCDSDNGGKKSSASELTLDNLGGIFVVLLGGGGIASILAVGEFIWKSRKLAIQQRESLWSEIGRELTFALKCTGDTKPARKRLSEREAFLSSMNNIRQPPAYNIYKPGSL